MKGEVARQAVAAGADIVNNTSPSDLMETDNAVPMVCMHSRGSSADMYAQSQYSAGVASSVVEELTKRISGSKLWKFNVIVDPGLGFAKKPEDNWELLRDIGRVLGPLNCTSLLGASNKRFLKEQLKTDSVLEGNLAVVGYAAATGVDIVRVHEVKETKAFLSVADRLSRP
jgi:dihydropteroate synthase